MPNLLRVTSKKPITAAYLVKVCCVLVIILFVIDLASFIFFDGGYFKTALSDAANGFQSRIKVLLNYHYDSFRKDARRYYLLPEGSYTYGFLLEPLKYSDAVYAMSNSVFHVIFQPLSLCVFTPQTILFVLMFPFFVIGGIRYFTKVPVMILAFFVLAVYIGLRGGSFVEPLLRHKLVCDLMYLLIGIAGFTGLITER